VTAFDRLIAPAHLEALFIFSIVSFVASLIALPIILVRLPQDYFHAAKSRTWLKGRHPILRVLAIGLKNLAGAMLVVGGVAMLLLPGQGLLTLLIGVSLMDFPGKHELERRIVARPAVLKAINAVRQRFHRPPLRVRDAMP
jgi:hypothetical protein